MNEIKITFECGHSEDHFACTTKAQLVRANKGDRCTKCTLLFVEGLRLAREVDRAALALQRAQADYKTAETTYSKFFAR